MIHKTHNYQLSLCLLFSLTDKNQKKTISQSLALRGEEIGQDKETERKRKMLMRREQVLTK